MTAPSLTVQVGIPGVDIPSSAAAVTWTDVTADLELGDGGAPVEIGWGRADEIAQADPNWCTLTFAASEFRQTATGPYAILDSGQRLEHAQALRARGQALGYAVRDRFHGYVSSITPLWPDGDVDHLRIEVRAESRLAWIARAKELQDRTSKAILDLGATSYWPMSEAVKSNDGTAKSSPPWFEFDDQARIWSISANAERGTGGGFGKAPDEDRGPAPDGLKIASFKPGRFDTTGDVDSRNAAQAAMPRVSAASAWSAAMIARLGRTEATEVAQFAALNLRGCDDLGFHAGPIDSMFDSGGPDQHGGARLVWADNGGSPFWFLAYQRSSSLNADSVSDAAPQIRDREWHLFAMTSSGGATPTLRAYFDGDLVATVSVTSGTIALNSVSVGDFQYYTHDSESIDIRHEFGRLAIWNGTRLTDAQIAQLHEDVINQAGEGDTVTERMQRWVRYGGIDTSLLEVSSPGATPLLPQVPAGTALALMQDVARTDAGALFDGRSGTVRYRGPSDRITSPVSLTLDVAADEVDSGLTAPADVADVINSVTITAADDSAKVVVSDNASVARFGYVSEETTLVSGSVTYLRARAETRLRTTAYPHPRAPGLSLELAALPEIQQDAVLALDVWSVVELAGLPGEVDGIPSSFFIEGGSESWGHQSCHVTLNITDASPEREYGIYDDPARGRFDSATFS